MAKIICGKVPAFRDVTHKINASEGKYDAKWQREGQIVSANSRECPGDDYS